jgi:hypothetical protein
VAFGAIAFPTTLDGDPPIGGLAPVKGQALMLAALEERRPSAAFMADLLERRQN